MMALEMPAGFQLYINGKRQEINVIFNELNQKSILNGNDFLVGNWTPRNFKNGTYQGFEEGEVDEVRLYARELSPLEVKELTRKGQADVAAFEASESEKLTHFRQLWDSEYRKQRHILDSLRSFNPTIPYVMIMDEMEEPRETFLLARGRYDAPTEKVQPGTPAEIMPFPESFPSNRLGLGSVDDSPRQSPYSTGSSQPGLANAHGTGTGQNS